MHIIQSFGKSQCLQVSFLLPCLPINHLTLNEYHQALVGNVKSSASIHQLLSCCNLRVSSSTLRKRSSSVQEIVASSSSPIWTTFKRRVFSGPPSVYIYIHMFTRSFGVRHAINLIVKHVEPCWKWSPFLAAPECALQKSTVHRAWAEPSVSLDWGDFVVLNEFIKREKKTIPKASSSDFQFQRLWIWWKKFCTIQSIVA